MRITGKTVSAGRRVKTVMFAALAALLLGLLPVVIAGCGESGNGGGGGGEASGTPIDAGLPKIELTAPDTAGAGEVPGFAWESADGAVSYRLVVLDGSGALLWAWTGADTRVNLGGLPGERPEGVGGPVITAGSSWSVVAFDGSGKAVAVSDIRPVSP